MGWVDFGYDETGVIPGGNGESSEQAENKHHKLLRVDNVEKKHRRSRQEDSESYIWIEHNIIRLSILVTAQIKGMKRSPLNGHL